MLRPLYDWTMDKAAHRHAVWWLCAFAFAEATFFPIPADVLLIPMIMAVRQNALRLSIVCALASATGGEFGYAIGYYFYEAVGKPIIEFYGYTAQFAELQDEYRKYGEWIVAIGAISPIPYKVVTITSGVAQMDFVAYTATSYGTRMIRFLAVGGLLWYFGPPIKRFIEERMGLAALLFLALFIGGFAVIKWVI